MSRYHGTIVFFVYCSNIPLFQSIIRTIPCEMSENKSCIWETLNLSTDADDTKTDNHGQKGPFLFSSVGLKGGGGLTNERSGNLSCDLHQMAHTDRHTDGDCDYKT